MLVGKKYLLKFFVCLFLTECQERFEVPRYVHETQVCIFVYVNSMCVHVGILQETNFEVSKIIILLLCLYNLSLKEFKKIVT